MMNLVDIAPAHCGTLMGVCNGFSSFAGFFVPLATTYFTEDDPSNPANWRNLFFLRYVPRCQLINLVHQAVPVDRCVCAYNIRVNQMG